MLFENAVETVYVPPVLLASAAPNVPTVATWPPSLITGAPTSGAVPDQVTILDPVSAANGLIHVPAAPCDKIVNCG